MGLARFHSHLVQSILAYTFWVMVTDSAFTAVLTPNIYKLVVLPLMHRKHALKVLLQQLMKSGLGKQEQIINTCV